MTKSWTLAKVKRTIDEARKPYFGDDHYALMIYSCYLFCDSEKIRTYIKKAIKRDRNSNLFKYDEFGMLEIIYENGYVIKISEEQVNKNIQTKKVTKMKEQNTMKDTLQTYLLDKPNGYNSMALLPAIALQAIELSKNNDKFVDQESFINASRDIQEKVTELYQALCGYNMLVSMMGRKE